MNYAYVTLVARDKYVDGAICLAKSLKGKTDYPLIAMTFDLTDAGTQRLEAMGIRCRPVEKITSVNAGVGDNKVRLDDFRYTYTKLHVFGYDEFDKIIFLDSDLIVIQSIDHLFTESKEDFSATDCTPYFEDIFNSGVMVITPSQALFKDMISKKDTLSSYDGSDQGFLNTYFKDRWQKLDIKYNSGKRIFSEKPELWEKIDKHVIHFVGTKPWLGGEKGYEPLEKIWFEYFNRE